MHPHSIDELHQFHCFLGEKLKNGGTHLSPEEALDEWRQQHPDSQSFDEEVVAIQEALDDIAHGDVGVSFEEFDQEFRKPPLRRRDLPDA